MLTIIACSGPWVSDSCGLDENGKGGITVYVGSRSDGPGLHVGRPAVCDDGEREEAARLLQRAHQVADRLPTSLRPATIDIHLTPRVADGAGDVEGLEYHRPAGALLAGHGAGDLHDTVWFHELAHVTMARRLDGGDFARAWREAIEEGIADYHAAAIARRPQLGPFGAKARGRRDLSRAPEVRPGDWESLALPNVAFDPHRLGWSFAAAAYAFEPQAGALLQDLLKCGNDPLPSRWIAQCPQRSRATIEALLRGWMPAELAR